ncbi:hypothetical protein M3Y96_00415900 [Aphelenchoides besseyi]|nr:hypothetical protein M3Y96_00415900 [Aphelenchoides besseyi]
MPSDVNNLEEIQKFLSGNSGKNLLVKFTVPKTNQKFELDCGHDNSKFSERLHASLQELMEYLNKDEELVIDVEICHIFKTVSTRKQQRAQLDKAEEAAKAFYPEPVANFFYRSVVSGPFHLTPIVQRRSAANSGAQKSTDPVEDVSTDRKTDNQKPIDNIFEKMDRTQDDSSYQKRKKKRLYYTKDVERIARISLEVADEIESPVRTAESLNSPRKNKKSKTSPKIDPLEHN